MTELLVLGVIVGGGVVILRQAKRQKKQDTQDVQQQQQNEKWTQAERGHYWIPWQTNQSDVIGPQVKAVRSRAGRYGMPRWDISFGYGSKAVAYGWKNPLGLIEKVDD